MSTYHERVARAMKATYMAGTLNSYETILRRLHEVFPDEGALRAYVGKLEAIARASGEVPADWTLTDERPAS